MAPDAKVYIPCSANSIRSMPSNVKADKSEEPPFMSTMSLPVPPLIVPLLPDVTGPCKVRRSSPAPSDIWLWPALAEIVTSSFPSATSMMLSPPVSTTRSLPAPSDKLSSPEEAET